VLANALIGLREGLEAGLVVGILVAFLNKLDRRDVLPRLWLGIAGAIVISLGVGAILTFGPYGMTSQAQEALGGTLSIAAVGLVTWMIFWMARHARHLKGELQGQLATALAGSTAAIVVLGIISVGREGVETALFVWASITSSGQALLGSIGALLGILASFVISYLIYRGFVRINLSRFFFWTGLFLVLVAAGVFAYGLGDLQEAGILPAGAAAYNLNSIIPASSWYGTLMGGLFQFKADPSWLQVVGWIAYAATVLALFLRVGLAKKRALAPATGAADSEQLAPAHAGERP
jgi:high-affinity iron transporter